MADERRRRMSEDARAGRARRRARDVRRAAHARGGRRVLRQLLLVALRGGLPAHLDGPRGDLPLRRGAPPRPRRGRVRARPRSLHALARDGGVGADRAPGAGGGPRDRDGRRDGRARGAGGLPRPARRGDARLLPALGGRALERRDPRRPAPAAAADRGGARPALDARQDVRAGRGRAARDVPAGPRAPPPGADRPRARGARGRDPAAVRRAARRLERRAAAGRGARARDRRAAGRAARPAPRAPAAARAAARPRRETTFTEEVGRLRDAHPELGIELAAGSEAVGVPPGSSRSPSRCSSRRCATRASTRSRSTSR